MYVTLGTGEALGQALCVAVCSVWTLDGVDTAQASRTIMTHGTDSSIAQLSVIVTRVVEGHRIVDSVWILAVNSRHTPVAGPTVTYQRYQITSTVQTGKQRQYL